MRIAITGGNSKFSKELQHQNSKHTLIPLDKKILDVTNLDSIEVALKDIKPDVLIHTAGLSRPMKLHNTNPELSIQLNVVGTANCVTSCIKYGIKLIYISTDFVYPGEQGNYSEEDALLPINKYAWSKLGGECACMLYDNSLILRMAMTEKPFPHEKAFTDCFKSSIWYPDAARVTLDLIDKGAVGIYNVGGERKSIYDFVFKENFNIFKETKNNVAEKVPNDVSMNVNKLKQILNDSAI